MSQGNPAPPDRIREMFDQIAGVYDGMNLAISGFQEPRWRHQAVTDAAVGPGDSAIDVACGTGKVSRDLLRTVAPVGSVLGVDASPKMIEQASAAAAGPEHLRFVVGDALALPAQDDSFDAATIAFGMRNLADYRLGFSEMARVVRPGGRVVCLEIARPESRLGKLVASWFDHIVPLIGRVVGQGGAYSYLVQSTKDYPAPAQVAEIMASAGLESVSWRGLSGGMVTIHVGMVPTAARAQHTDAYSPHD